METVLFSCSSSRVVVLKWNESITQIGLFSRVQCRAAQLVGYKSQSGSCFDNYVHVIDRDVDVKNVCSAHSLLIISN